MVNDIGHIFGKIVLFLRGGSQCDEFLVRAQICKNTGGYKRIFLQKYERCTGKNTSAESQLIHFSKRANCHLFLQCCQLLEGPFNGLSGLFKLELLSFDSFYCQGGYENFI